MAQLHKIALGGGCHWCTEAVFQSLKGVMKVEQGFVASIGSDCAFSEAVVVHYFPDRISMGDLIAIHLHTHQSTKRHHMRSKYRSAVYTWHQADHDLATALLLELQADFEERLVTRVLPFHAFRPSDIRFHDYYFSDRQKPFCQVHIEPKLQVLMAKFSRHVKEGIGI